MSQSTQHVPESGLLSDYVAFLRETTTGEMNSDPDWLAPSDNIREITVTPGVNVERREGLGSPDPSGHDRTPDEPTIAITYDAQRPVVAANGNPDCPSGDAWLRNADGLIYSTHSLLIRDERTTPDANDPDDVTGARQYAVGLGGHPNASVEYDPSEAGPSRIEMEWDFEVVRQYEVFQPGGNQLAVTGLAAGNSITLEDEDAATSETLDSDGTTTASFDDLDGAWLDQPQDDDVVVAIDGVGGSDLVTIRGGSYHSQNADQPVEGDQGIPVLGAGSRASEVGTAFEYFVGSTVTRGGAALDYDLNRVSSSVDNGYDPTPRSDSWRNRYHAGNRELELEADVVGWGASVDFEDQALGVNGEDIVLELSKTRFTFGTAVVMEPGDTERTDEDAAAEYSVTFGPESLTVENVEA